MALSKAAYLVVFLRRMGIVGLLMKPVLYFPVFHWIWIILSRT
jgi:hypothetical protein